MDVCEVVNGGQASLSYNTSAEYNELKRVVNGGQASLSYNRPGG